MYAYDIRLRKNRIQYRLSWIFFFYTFEKGWRNEKSHLRGKEDRSILDGCTCARDKSACHAEFILLLFYNGFLSQTLSTRCNSTQFPDSACIPNKTESGSQNISLIQSCKSIFKTEIFNFFSFFFFYQQLKKIPQSILHVRNFPNRSTLIARYC